MSMSFDTFEDIFISRMLAVYFSTISIAGFTPEGKSFSKIKETSCVSNDALFQILKHSLLMNPNYSIIGDSISSRTDHIDTTTKLDSFVNNRDPRKVTLMSTHELKKIPSIVLKERGGPAEANITHVEPSAYMQQCVTSGHNSIVCLRFKSNAYYFSSTNLLPTVQCSPYTQLWLFNHKIERRVACDPKKRMHKGEFLKSYEQHERALNELGKLMRNQNMKSNERNISKKKWANLHQGSEIILTMTKMKIDDSKEN